VARPAPKKTTPADRRLAELRSAMQRYNAGDRAGALKAIRAVLKADPANAQAHRLCAVVLSAAGDRDRALFHAQQAVKLAPAASPVHTTLGSVLDAMGDPARALESMRAAVKLNPNDVEGLTTLAITLDSQERYDEALEVHSRALAADPNHAVAGLNAAISMLAMGRARDAVDLMQRIASARPGDTHAAERLAFCMNYDDRATRASINLAHHAYGQCLENTTKQVTIPYRQMHCPLRIGLVSPDLRAHSVASFLGPPFDHLDKDKFTLCPFFTSKHADAVTESLRQRSDEWHDCAGLSPADLAAHISKLNIDILIDLSGLFAGHRIPTFAATPAPIQATWLGYPNTTGLTRIHARFVDSLTDPPEFDGRPDDIRETEKLIRLDPCFICYNPPADAPDPAGTPPSTTGEPFTFGSFNDIKKINPTTLGMWAGVLEKAPKSRLFLKAGPLGAKAVREHILSSFQERGIDPGRLLLAGRSPSQAGHLAEYHKVDLALDTFPYCGTTTTCEALWMGVPVLSRIGETHASRVGLSLLTNTGLPNLAAPDSESFIHRAAELATNAALLAETRADLRARFLASAVCDAPAFAARFAGALQTLAQEHST